MKNKISKIVLATSVLLFGSPLIIAPASFASDPCADTTIPESVRQSAYHCDPDSGAAINSAGSAVGNILSIIIGALGIVAVIFIVMGGVQYMTSAGDATKLKRAKDTILYACIGLAICALAFAITQFAINAINNSTDTTNSTSTSQLKYSEKDCIVS